MCLMPHLLPMRCTQQHAIASLTLLSFSLSIAVGFSCCRASHVLPASVAQALSLRPRLCILCGAIFIIIIIIIIISSSVSSFSSFCYQTNKEHSYKYSQVSPGSDKPSKLGRTKGKTVVNSRYNQSLYCVKRVRAPLVTSVER